MTLIRLIDEAPWNVVTLPPNFKISKNIPIPYTEEIDYSPIKKFVVIYDEEPSQPSKPEVDYNTLSKSELVSLAAEKGITTAGKSKGQLIEELSANGN